MSDSVLGVDNDGHCSFPGIVGADLLKVFAEQMRRRGYGRTISLSLSHLPISVSGEYDGLLGQLQQGVR